jgi:cell division protein FtsI/penicillin-binding protein 2
MIKYITRLEKKCAYTNVELTIFDLPARCTLPLYFRPESTIKPFTATLIAHQGHLIHHIVSAYFYVVDTDLPVRG